jgi:GT2 family glycosyltransferase/glycosyltransferase involved in cell wall biosynthesis
MTDQRNHPLLETIEAQAERIVRLERQLEARTIALDAVTAECARLTAQTRVPEVAKPIAPRPHLTWDQRARKAVVLAGGKLLPAPAKRFVKRFWDPWAQPRRVAAKPIALPRANRIATTTTYDVIGFSIIDWSFRWQRPQQLLSQFADAGHRVFVFKTTEFLHPGADAFQIVPLRENVWEVTIAPPVVIDVYAGTIDPATAAWFPTLFEELRRELNIVSAVSIVQVATWRQAAVEARRRFGWKIVYDCMDEWDSFPGMKSGLLTEEELLVPEADVVTVSAQRLFDKWHGRNPRVVLVRNATDFAHFTAPQREHLLDGLPHPIIGYFGAVAPWFDVALLAAVAASRPQSTFVVIGGVFDVDVAPLRALANVHLLGQQPYARMPSYLRDFDACMIPFVVNDITAATDPVKFYEYISLGKPVVSTHMPELEPYAELLYFADDADGFAQQLDRAVTEKNEAIRARRVAVARANTWPARAAVMQHAIRDAHPKVSVIVVSYDNHELTRLCLDSVRRNSMYPNLEVLVIDNGSKDGSAEMLEAWRDERVRVVLNRENAGFAAANNQGLQLATGDYAVLLNNDTVVPRGWLPRMLRHLDDPQIGLAVAVTNFSGNESRIAVPYTTLDDMELFADAHMREHDGERFDIRVAAMYCVGMRRDVHERIGPLDEAFGIGMFEDDDYSHRARLAGFRVVCMEDVFVHHFGQASFSKLDAAAYDEVWKRNQAHFERKWGMHWQPHRPR